MTDPTKDAERLALLERAKSIYHEACVMPRHITVEVIADHLAAEIAAARREDRELRALDAAVIEAARELLEVSGRSRQLAYSRERLQDAFAARDAAIRERGGEE